MSIKVFALAVILVGLSQWNVTNAAQSSDKPNSYFIQGAVKKPGVYQIESSPSLSTLIALAGGLSENHGASAFIIRRVIDQTGATDSAGASVRAYSVIPVDMRGLLKGELLKDAILTAGDIVNIPPSELFFVTGNANRMSSFPLRETITVSQALSLPGVKSVESIREVIILRSDPVTGKREEIKVNLDEVTSGKAIDVLIKADDIIVLPNAQTGPDPLRFLDAPPMRVFPRCHGSLPCLARSGL